MHLSAQGNPSKGIQVRVSTKGNKSSDHEPTSEQIEFANWFKNLLPQDQQDRLPKNWLKTWSKTYDELVRIDKRDPAKIREVCQWARTDSFWKSNFRSPSKLRDRDSQGTLYFDLFAEKAKAPTANAKPTASPTDSIIIGGRTYRP